MRLSNGTLWVGADALSAFGGSLIKEEHGLFTLSKSR